MKRTRTKTKGKSLPPKSKKLTHFLLTVGASRAPSASSESTQPKPAAAPSKETTKSKVAKELKLFLKVTQLDPKDDPMKWWKENQSSSPTLAQVARRVLAIPASSAPSERVFSKMARLNAKDQGTVGCLSSYFCLGFCLGLLG